MVESRLSADQSELDEAKAGMIDYIMNMIEYVCSGDEKEDKRNMKLLAQSILERSLELHKAQIAKFKQKQKEAQAIVDNKTLEKLAECQVEGQQPPKLEEIMTLLENLRLYYME